MSKFTVKDLDITLNDRTIVFRAMSSSHACIGNKTINVVTTKGHTQRVFLKVYDTDKAIAMLEQIPSTGRPRKYQESYDRVLKAIKQYRGIKS